MRDMNSPGMALVLADRDGVQRVVHYGFGDLEARQPAGEDTLFEIGSISKSFVALALLQLRDEGKLDLDRPDRRVPAVAARRFEVRARSRRITC